jgi:glyoxylase-like metal-dependent hydrolase (beta-lactamase superfamily II)
MNVVHLNCGTFHIFGQTLVCHCLLVETDAGLTLVDAGVGLDDLRHPSLRMQRWLTPVLDEAATAAAQVVALGHRVEDVRHIVLTHLDSDHVGGVEDFPNAVVHVHRAELDAALNASSTGLWGRVRYRPAQWALLTARLRPHRGSRRDRRFDLPVVEQLDLPAGVQMVELPGHTWGHCGLVVDLGSRVLLHAGDAYFRRSEITPGAGWLPRSLSFGSRLDRLGRVGAWAASLAAVRRIAAEEDAVDVFCTHDPDELRKAQAGALSASALQLPQAHEARPARAAAGQREAAVIRGHVGTTRVHDTH